MHPLDWLIVVALNGTVVGYGLYLARGTKSSSDWFLGRRALPWWVIGLSMFATNVDNADIVSVTGKTYDEGLHIISVYAIGSAVGCILAAFVIVPRIYQLGCYTNAEYLETRFGVATRILSALIQIQYRSSMLGLMLWSIFLLLTGMQIVNPAQAWVLIVVLAVGAGLYTAWGGLQSVVWTDALQGLIMMGSGAVIFAAVWGEVGGWSGMSTTLQTMDADRGTRYADLLRVGAFDGGPAYRINVGNYPLNFGAYTVVLGWTIVGSGYWTVNHTQTMRLLGARSLWDMKMAAITGVAISLPIMIGCACLGVFGRALPDAAELTTSDGVFPHLANRYLGVGAKGLVVAGIVSAAISTFDSMGSALSAIFTRDVYARLLVTDREDRHYVIVGRWATVGILSLGFLYLPFIALQKSMLDAFTTLIPVFVTPLFTIYAAGALTRAHPRSGLIALLVGSLYGLFALWCREAPRLDFLAEVAWAPLWLTDRWAALGWSLLITATTMAVCSLCLGTADRADRPSIDRQGWLARSRQTLPSMSAHPFRGPLPIWASPRLYAAILLAVCFYVVFVVFW